MVPKIKYSLLLSLIVYSSCFGDDSYKHITIYNYIKAKGNPAYQIDVGTAPVLYQLSPAINNEPSMTKIHLRTTLHGCESFPSRGIITYIFNDYGPPNDLSGCTFEYDYVHFQGNCNGQTHYSFKVNSCTAHLYAYCQPDEKSTACWIYPA